MRGCGGQYAALIILDIVTRVVPAVLAWWFGWGLGAWLWITVIGTVSWLLLAAVSPATRRAMALRADVPVRRFIPLMITAMGAAGASAVLVTGFPTLVKISADHGAGALGAVTAAGSAITPMTAAATGAKLFRTIRERAMGVAGDDHGMSTVEYALGTVAAAAFGALLYTVVTGGQITDALTDIIERALNTQ